MLHKNALNIQLDVAQRILRHFIYTVVCVHANTHQRSAAKYKSTRAAVGGGGGGGGGVKFFYTLTPSRFAFILRRRGFNLFLSFDPLTARSTRAQILQ